jgi:hypothetical protein
MFSGIHPIDDPGIFSLYSSSPALSRILLSLNGYYYRPMVEFSYWLDNQLWEMEPIAMHLENILLHCANCLLVFVLARKVSTDKRDTFPLIPMLAALLFALHPVNVEAVAWIAGRTDPILAFFVLSACYFWLRWLEDSRWQHIAATLLLFTGALLTKETALAFGAVIVVTMLAWPGKTAGNQRMAAIGIMSIPGLLLVLIVLAFRSGTTGLSRFISGMDLQIVPGIRNVLTAFGFYVTKLIIPLPLNFAITEVNPNYVMAGFVLLPILLWGFKSNRIAGVLMISATFFLLPAVLISIMQVAWTPFAERYMYLPSALFAVGVSALVLPSGKIFRGALILITFLVLSGFAYASLYRTVLWNDKLAFFQDSVAKSPKFGSVYYSLGSILLQKGDAGLAFQAFSTADILNKRHSMRNSIKAGLMGAKLAKGEFREVRNLFFKYFKDKESAPAEFLELLYLADNKRMDSVSNNEKALLAADLLQTLSLLNQKRYDPFWFYRSGQLSLITGDKVKATDYFSRAYSLAPVDAYYRTAAKMNLQKLEHAK